MLQYLFYWVLVVLVYFVLAECIKIIWRMDIHVSGINMKYKYFQFLLLVLDTFHAYGLRDIYRFFSN